MSTRVRTRAASEPTTTEDGKIPTGFTLHELKYILNAAEHMTKGAYFLPPPRKGHAPHAVRVDTMVKVVYRPDEEKEESKGETICAFLAWGPDVLEDEVTVLDTTLSTGTKERLANATVISWVGNNLALLLKEHVAMRTALDAMGLVVDAEVRCPVCKGNGECTQCKNTGALPLSRGREIMVEILNELYMKNELRIRQREELEDEARTERRIDPPSPASPRRRRLPKR